MHGLSTAFLRDKPKFGDADVVEAFLEFVGDAALIAHNAAFDRDFINAELERIGRQRLCRDALDRHAGPRPEALSGHVQLAGRAL